MIVVLVSAALFLLVWMRRRRKRAATLAGLDGSRPAFSVEPPRRRLSGLKDQRL